MTERKIAIIGNMNNNGFSLLRYLQDAGEDVTLLLYRNDGRGTLSHFRPNSDCWDIERWSPHIRRIPVTNGFLSVPPMGLGIVLWFFWTAWSLTRGNPLLSRVVSAPEIREILAAYTHIIGSGVAPALCHRAGRKIDIFFPYAQGVEFVESPTIRKLRSNPLLRPIAVFFGFALRNQIAGIQGAQNVFNAERGITEEVLCKLGVKSLAIGIPMVYQDSSEATTYSLLSKLEEKLGTFDFACISLTRQLWEEKRNDLFLREFARLLGDNEGTGIGLILSEYGPDVRRARSLINALGIEEFVVWAPLMPRKLTRVLARQCDVAIGEFITTRRTFWGGTGWEALADGKPFLQGFNFEDEEFEKTFGFPEPPILKVQKEEDIYCQLEWALKNPDRLKEISSESAEWFSDWGGKNLAARWLRALV